MKRPPISRAALGIFRALVERVENKDRHRILLSDCTSVEWQSLTFAGERHSLIVRVIGPLRANLAERLTLGLGDAEFSISGHLVADIASGQVITEDDRSVMVSIDALTISE